MSILNAWILDLGMGYKAALGGRELLHLLDVHSTFSVPNTPPYCHQVVAWQERLLPVMDIAARLSGATQQAKFLAVIGYQKKRGEYPQFGALQLLSPPLKVEVSDEQACALPANLPGWDEMAISCFEYQNEAIPVLNLNRVFNRPFTSLKPKS